MKKNPGFVNQFGMENTSRFQPQEPAVPFPSIALRESSAWSRWTPYFSSKFRSWTTVSLGMNHQIGGLHASKVSKKMVVVSIGVRNEVVVVFAVRFCAVCVQQNLKWKFLVERIFLVSKSFFRSSFSLR